MSCMTDPARGFCAALGCGASRTVTPCGLRSAYSLYGWRIDDPALADFLPTRIAAAAVLMTKPRPGPLEHFSRAQERQGHQMRYADPA